MNTDRPLVSVLVLTYNHEQYVRQALESILMQDVNFEYEILVGDDCSTDGTVEILKEYARNYSSIKLFLNPTNLGATKNACNLLESARGYYLATCEGDDFWTDSEKLRLQVGFLENNHQFIGCTHHFQLVDENNLIINENLDWVLQKDEFSIYDFKGYILPGQPSTFVRRNLFFDKKIEIKSIHEIHPMIGDRTAILLFLMHGKFGLIKRCMSCYRRCRIARKSITDLTYQNHFDAVNSDYEITCKLENIAKENSLNLNFDGFKKILFAKASIYFLLNRDTRFLDLMNKIFNKNRFGYICFVPYFIVGYIVKKFFKDINFVR